MSDHVVTGWRMGEAGPGHLFCTCGLGYIAELRLMTDPVSYDYDKMHALMDVHLDEVGA